jgi:hypothetical protein
MRTERLVVGAAAAIALLLVVLVPTYPNYDAYYHLVWGRELLDGMKPGFEAYSAPTQHPLFLAVCAVLGLLGDGADRVLVALTVLSHVVLVWGVYRLGRAVFGHWPGLAAAFFCGSSFGFLLFAAKAYVDIPFLALVVWAAVLEAEGGGRLPRGDRRVAAVLAVAGLLRPEAWVLAGAYWLFSGVRRVDLLLLAAAAPVGWAVVDLWVTGDPLFSLHATSDLAEELRRKRGLGEVPKSFVTFLSSTLRPPVFAAALIGVALAWRLRGWRSVAVPLALVAAGALTFVASGVAGLSVLPRYLTVPAVALCVFAGYAVAGFTTLARDSPLRRRWRQALVAGAVVGAVFAVVKAPVVGRLFTELRFIRSTHDELVSLLRSPEVERDLRCGKLTFPNYRLVPDARWILDLPESRVGARSDRREDRGVAIFVHGKKALNRFGYAAGADRSTVRPDPGFEPIARRDRFSASSRCGGA